MTASSYTYWTWYRPTYCLNQAVSMPILVITLTACLRLRGRFQKTMRERTLPGN